MGEKGNELIYYILKMPCLTYEKIRRVDVVMLKTTAISLLIQRSWKDNRSKGQITYWLGL